MIWYEEGKNTDIIVSTRIRLARNIRKYPFPNAMTKAQMEQATKEITSAITGGNSVLANNFTTYHIGTLNEIDRGSLIEKHLISPELGENSSVLVSEDKSMSIMLMEEDHIRLQVIMGGPALDEAWDLANKVDDLLEESMEFAFHKDLGYLTACPTNTGTGLRASVMMHLPALTMTNNMEKIISSASSLGIAIRGLYGEGSKAYGALYQISNQMTTGMTEQELIEKLKNIVMQIKKHEESTIKRLLSEKKDYLEDRLWRSYGTLKYARSLSSAESKSLISDVILGKNLGIIENEGKNHLKLLIETEPYTLNIGEEKILSPDERDKKRAAIIRQSV